MSEYTPISCTFYDFIEHYAVRCEEVLVEYTMGDSIHQVRTRILDTKNTGQAEYMIIEVPPQKYG